MGKMKVHTLMLALSNVRESLLFKIYGEKKTHQKFEISDLQCLSKGGGVCRSLRSWSWIHKVFELDTFDLHKI